MGFNLQPWVRLYIWTEGLPRRGYRTQLRVSTLGNPQNKRFALKLKGRERRVPDEARTYGRAKVRVRQLGRATFGHRTPLPPC
jgi:hypothetical protein